MATAPVIIPASVQQTATVIFLHGLGDTGHGWASSLANVKPPHAKLICPTAPTMPVTLNCGMRMPSWFDLKSLDPRASEDVEGIKNAAKNIHAIIQSEISNGISAKRIVIGGFSQGGALALFSGLTMNAELGGVVALSSWLPLHKEFPYGGGIQKPPVLQCHGDSDPLVIFSFGSLTSQVLRANLADYAFKVYPGLQHSSCEQELEDVKTFFKRVLP